MAEDSTGTSAADIASATGVREDDEHESKETVLLKYFLQEWEVVKSILDRIVASGSVSDPADAQKIRTIVDKYQEQGHLLEPFLETIVCPLMFIMRSKAIQLDFNFDEITPLSIIIYSLVTVCGYKSVIRFFPHQVSDLELAVSLLERCHNATSATSLRQESTGEMEMKCVVLLWLYILVLIPFDLSSVDSRILNTNDPSGPEPSPLLLKMIGLSKDYLSNAGPMRRIAGLLLSRLLTRPDMLKDCTSFFQWAHEVLLSVNDDIVDHFKLLGIVEALASIFTVGRRNILLGVASTIWSDISLLSKSKIASQSSLLRKLIMKLSQRIGLACLPHRIPLWQYQVKKNHLGENVSSSTTINCHSCGLEHIEGHYEIKEDMDTPDIIEEIIELLLSGLRDSDTVVRWSAAKGIGRITARLTSSLAEDVLSSILELFSPCEGDGSWHGGSLALAELAHRGLLLPTSLPQVIPVIIKALHYDIRRGPHSVGSHVRDAAAYVCWAFGRAYYHKDMKSNLEQLAPHLLMVACYDREVNCRRAAAAAFQENVGRQGAFPHGIDIINAADYFSLASRSSSYLKVAVYVAQYKDYLYPFIDELINHKISHWDKSIRELSAKAVSVLAKYDPHYFEEYAIEKLSRLTLSSDLSMRHGATLAVGELVLSLYQCGLVFSNEKQKAISGIVPAIEKARLYRGKGGEIMRSSVCRFIECMSLAHIHLTEKTKRSLHETLNENLKHPNPQIQCSSVDALKHFFPTYFPDVGDEVAKAIISKYLELLKNPNPAARRGSALAIGILPYEYLAPNRKDVISKLSNICLIQDKSEDQDAETRVNAIRSLVSVCATLTDPKNLDHANAEDESLLFLQIKGEVMQTLFKALDDYAVDNRGDVGSWVREAAMIGLERCTNILRQKDSVVLRKHPVVETSNWCSVACLFDANIAAYLVGALAKQAVEKLDKLREIASKTLQRILYQQHSEIIIPHHEALVEIISNDADIEWNVPSVCYPRFMKLLEFSCYRKPVLSGLVISLGGLQESLRKASSTSLLDYIKGSESDVVEKRNARECSIGVDLLWILTFYHKSDRVSVPTLKTTEFLLSQKVFVSSEAFTHDFCAGVLEILTVELRRTKDFSKLLAGLSILGYIASVPDLINTSAFSLLLSFLSHRYPRIRRASADQIYLVILQNGSFVPQDKIEAALEILTETCWEGNVEETKLHMSRLSAMTGLDLKASEKELKDHKRCVFKDENMSYSSLVGFSGF